MNKQEPRPEIESTERQSEYFEPDYPSGLHCHHCLEELTRWEASHYEDEFNRKFCIDCWE